MAQERERYHVQTGIVPEYTVTIRVSSYFRITTLMGVRKREGSQSAYPGRQLIDM
jgi:hypothetical protein